MKTGSLTGARMQFKGVNYAGTGKQACCRIVKMSDLWNVNEPSRLQLMPVHRNHNNEIY